MTTRPHGQEESSDKGQKGNLGQQEAGLEKEKESELSNIGKTRSRLT